MHRLLVLVASGLNTLAHRFFVELVAQALPFDRACCSSRSSDIFRLRIGGAQALRSLELVAE
jgi:hypothetical protein